MDPGRRSFGVLAREERIIRINPERLARSGVSLQEMGAFDKAGRALEIIHIGHGHSPISHGAIRIQRRHLPEGTLRLEIPESVQLSDALIEEGLCLLIFAADFQFHFASAWDHSSPLPRPFVEGLAVKRMPRFD